MAGEAQRPGTARPRRPAIGERLAGFIYGTIVVLAVLVAGVRAFPDDAGRISAMVLVTSVVLWVAHVYSHALAHSVAHDERVSLAELRLIARREGSVVEAAVPPLAALLLGVFGVVSTNTAVWLAVGVGLVVLAAQGVVFARIERLRWPAMLLVVAANVGLGLALAALKVFLTH
jgi:hypothetical protein